MHKNPVISLLVAPAYGQNRCVVSWVLQEDYVDRFVTVWRSPNGKSDWVPLTETPLQLGSTSFLDKAPNLTQLNAVSHYRLTLEKDNEDPIISNPYAAYSALTRSEYAGVSACIRSEYRDMLMGSGVPVFHTSPKTSGDPLPGYDPYTGQLWSDMTCLQPEVIDDNSYRGFNLPWQTYIKFLNPSPMRRTEDTEGQGMSSTFKIGARMLVFPRPKPGDVIINPFTDERFVVDADVTPYLFKGICPIAYEVSLTLLPRTDACYKIPTPDLKAKGKVPVP